MREETNWWNILDIEPKTDILLDSFGPNRFFWT